MDQNKTLVLFDGQCNLCNASVQFILRRDKRELFMFSSLQSDAAKEILLHLDGKNIVPDSVVVQKAGRLLFESDAA